MITLTILTAVLWLWALVDISRAQFDNPASKWLWLFIIFVFPVVGSIAYFQLGKKFTKGSKRFDPHFHNTSG